MSPSALLAGTLELALNRYLSLDSDALAEIAALTGKVMALELLFTVPARGSGVGLSENARRLTLYLLPGPGGMRVVHDYAGSPDVLIRGNPLLLIRQAGRQGGGLLAAGVEIEGDTQLGKTFQKLLTDIEVDWEEQLSHWVGDVIAHQLGNVARGLRDWGRNATQTLFRNAAEYLQEEVGELPPVGAVSEYLDAVDTLRSDTDRLEARIRRLQQAIADRSPS